MSTCRLWEQDAYARDCGTDVCITGQGVTGVGMCMCTGQGVRGAGIEESAPGCEGVGVGRTWIGTCAYLGACGPGVHVPRAHALHGCVSWGLVWPKCASLTHFE